MDEDRRYFLPRLSVNRPVTVVMALVALLVVGYIANSRVLLALVPGGQDYPRLWINTSYRNATSIEVEQKVTKPIEEGVAMVSGVKKIETRSSGSNSRTTVQFRKTVDMKEAFAQMRDRMDRVMPELPDEVERIWIHRWDEDDIPLMYMVATFTEDYHDPLTVLETHVQPALQRVEGVGNVQVWGGRNKHLRIEMDQDKIRGHNIDVGQIVGQISGQNFTLPGGYVVEGGKKIYLRSMGKFSGPEELQSLLISRDYGLRLSDVAEVSLTETKRERIERIDGAELIGMAVRPVTGGNIVETSRQVRQVLDELKRKPHLQGLDFEIFWDQGPHIEEAVNNLKNAGMWGGLFAVCVLFLFLRAVRMTLIITLAIPLSLLVTVTVIYFMGWTLNIGTLMGLMLSVGLVVDNAIVIVENIYRKRQEGIEPRQASVEGAGEVGLAVTMATLTTVVVFLPLILMSGDDGMAFWMLRIGLPVMVGLVASLFIALAFIPLGALKLSARQERGELRFIVWLRERYVHCLEWVLRRRVDAVILVLATLASMQFPMEQVTRGEQQENRRDLDISFNMPPGQTLERANAFVSAIEDTLNNHRSQYNIKSIRTNVSPGWSHIEIFFNKEETLVWYEVAYRDLMEKLGFREKAYLEYNEIVEDVKKRLGNMPAGINMRVNWRNSGSSQDAWFALHLYGEDTRVLMALSEEVERRLQNIPAIQAAYTDMERGNTELQVRLDRERTRSYGIDPSTVSRNISYSLRGYSVGKFQTDNGREIDIYMQLEKVDRQNMQQLRNLVFPTADGKEVPLESLASLYVTRTLGSIRREDRQTMLSVTARADKDDSEGLFEQIDAAMRDFEMPRGYRWDKGARYVRLQEEDDSWKFALTMSIVFVFLLMGVLFESFVLPLSVIVAIPFSFLGVFWTLYITNTMFDIMAIIGTVILVGVVVNNAIVLVDLANRLRQGGMERTAALVEAGRHRFRPILMTTFTTVCGLIPMAVGNSKLIGLSYAPLGRTMMGGLLASTVLTLVVVPLCYTLFDDLRNLLRRVVASAFK